MKTELTKVLILLAVVTVLASIALTFAQPYYFMKEETNAEYHDEGEELMEQMHEEHSEMMNEMHQSNYNAQMYNETRESHSHHGCH